MYLSSPRSTSHPGTHMAMGERPFPIPKVGVRDSLPLRPTASEELRVRAEKHRSQIYTNLRVGNSHGLGKPKWQANLLVCFPLVLRKRLTRGILGAHLLLHPCLGALLERLYRMNIQFQQMAQDRMERYEERVNLRLQQVDERQVEVIASLSQL